MTATIAPSRSRRDGIVERQREPRAARRAGDRLGVEAAIGGILVLSPAVVAEREAGHRRVRPVVRHRADDREARAALRAVDEGVPVAAIGRVVQLAQAVVARGNVGRNERRAAVSLRLFAIVKLRSPRARHRLGDELLDARERRRFLARAPRRTRRASRVAFGLDHDAVAVVEDVPVELEPRRERHGRTAGSRRPGRRRAPVSPPLDCGHIASHACERDGVRRRRNRERPRVSLRGNRNRNPAAAPMYGSGRAWNVAARRSRTGRRRQRVISAGRAGRRSSRLCSGRGYRVVGPLVDQAGDRLRRPRRRADDLPVGWTDVQDAATYRLERRDDEAASATPSGPHSWKQFLFPPRVRQWRPSARRTAVRGRRRTSPTSRAACADRSPRLASCTRSRSRTGSSSAAPYTEPDYAARRDGAFIVAVNCFEPGGTCFCVSMETGPKVESGYDLALTEILDGEHRFLVEVGS